MENTITYPSATGNCTIVAREWLPEGSVKAVVQLVHGMAEHITRYRHLAGYLNSLGYAVYGDDHAGHGDSVNGSGKKGFFAEQDGWSCMIADIKTLHQTALKKYPNVKHILYGHSMGSFLARTYASRYPDDFNAYIFSGTAGKNPVLGIAKAVAKQQIKKLGPDKPSELLNGLAFGAYNKRIPNARTAVDWLTTDNAVVDEYVKDEFCGFTFTASAFRDLFDGLGEITGKQWAAKVKDVPICLLAGKQDPVGSYGRGVMEVCNNLKATGHTKVVLQLYENGRHEMHNEANREEVYRGIAAFLKSV